MSDIALVKRRGFYALNFLQWPIRGRKVRPSFASGKDSIMTMVLNDITTVTGCYQLMQLGLDIVSSPRVVHV